MRVFAFTASVRLEIGSEVRALASAFAVEGGVRTILATTHTSAEINLSVFEVLALAQTGRLVHGSMRAIFATAIPDIPGRQDHRVGIIALAKTGCSIDGSPLIFTLALSA